MLHTLWQKPCNAWYESLGTLAQGMERSQTHLESTRAVDRRREWRQTLRHKSLNSFQCTIHDADYWTDKSLNCRENLKTDGARNTSLKNWHCAENCITTLRWMHMITAVEPTRTNDKINERIGYWKESDIPQAQTCTKMQSLRTLKKQPNWHLKYLRWKCTFFIPVAKNFYHIWTVKVCSVHDKMSCRLGSSLVGTVT